MDDYPELELDASRLRTEAGAMRALARSILTQEDLADDAAQDAWLAFLRRPPRALRSLSAWLRSATRQSARNLQRRERRLRRREEQSQSAEASRAPQHELAVTESIRELVDAVERLHEPFRSVIVMHYLEGVSARDVAANLEVPLATVRSRIRRALVMLRADLSRREGGMRAVGLIAQRRRQRPWRTAVAWTLGASLAGFVAFVEYRYDSSLVGWALGRSGTSPANEEPRRSFDAPPSLAFALVGAAHSWSRQDEGAEVRPLIDSVVAAFDRPVEICATAECGKPERCPGCRALAEDDAHFERLRVLLKESESAWAVLDEYVGRRLSAPETSPSTAEGLWNVVVLSQSPLGRPTVEGLLETQAATCADAHLIALDEAGFAAAGIHLVERAKAGGLRAAAYLALQGDAVGAPALRRELREGTSPLEITIAATGWRALQVESERPAVFESSVERLRGCIVEALDAGAHRVAADRLAAAKHLLRTFGPNSEPRTFLGTPWWGLAADAAYVPWKPGAADPLAAEMQMMLRLQANQTPSPEAIRAQALAL